MSVSINNLFNYARSLPAPFDLLSDKRVKASSIYGGSHTEATLCASVLKGINAYCHAFNHTAAGAVGILDGQKYLAEYKSSVSPDSYHLVLYDASSGNFMASVYDRNTETMEQYTAHPSKRDAAALFFAMMPTLLSDLEFSDNWAIYNDQFKNGFPDFELAKTAAAIMCDNAYRRIKDDTCTAFVKTNVDKAGNLMRISQTQLDSGFFSPTDVNAGEFLIFTKVAPKAVSTIGEIRHEDFVGKYKCDPSRVLSEAERKLVPKLPEWYIIPEEVEECCLHCLKTTEFPEPMRNFLLRGPSGTGKTKGAIAIAAGLDLPYLKYTCSADTEIFDLVGMVFPETKNAELGSTGDPVLDKENELLESMGGFTFENVAKLMQLPDLDDLDYDPQSVYKSLTGEEKEDASPQDCMTIILNRVFAKVNALCQRVEPDNTHSQRFTYVETDFIRALKNGYVVEIQERATRS